MKHMSFLYSWASRLPEGGIFLFHLLPEGASAGLSQTLNFVVDIYYFFVFRTDVMQVSLVVWGIQMAMLTLENSSVYRSTLHKDKSTVNQVHKLE